jgi:hypothetical protein
MLVHDLPLVVFLFETIGYPKRHRDLFTAFVGTGETLDAMGVADLSVVDDL